MLVCVTKGCCIAQSNCWAKVRASKDGTSDAKKAATAMQTFLKNGRGGCTGLSPPLGGGGGGTAGKTRRKSHVSAPFM